ncbi:MAG: CPBP family glutamic-type intramembrane protease [Actinomycetota bacterium]|nr:CPBP family glutamic-type intramembrane protease [Actinomycetota bacterium]MDH5223686.1 CPBP family glutamic-type intramembrane protease [Actinomycetota bacterium]MDH5312290.1 CPBP family glutamic-type intramembrane protease [Actinomycetota bacterium]
MVLGTVGEFAGWWLVSTGRVDVWKLMPIVLGAMGVAAVWVRPPTAATEVDASTALAVGLGAGLALYVATRAFVWAAARWAPFRRDVLDQYGQAGEITLGTSLVLSLAIMVPAEELFWRGLFPERLVDAAGAVGAAAIAWFAYVGVNLASRSLPIVAGAIVGGALWAGLAWWSGGVLASLGSHILWTGLMLALPPGAGRPAIERGPST